MTIYLEYILLDNLAINTFLLYLTFLVRKQQAGIFRLFCSGFFGAVFSVLYPYLGIYNYFIKALLSPVMLLIAKKYKSFSDYIVSLTVFLIISFCMAGASVMISSFSAIDLTKYDGKLQLFPFCVFTSALMISMLLKICVKDFYKRRAMLKFVFQASVTTKKGKESVLALYDSGNHLFCPESGEPMVIISERLSQKLACEKEKEVFVRTVGGIKALKRVELNFEIYSRSGQNKIYKAKAGVSRDINPEYDIILHSEMTGE